jgi:cytochrome c oxidase cbb3-type subunit 3
MKIVSQYFETIAGIGIFPVISFLIFFLFFLGVTWYVFKLDRKFIKEVSNYPCSLDLDDEKEMNI